MRKLNAKIPFLIFVSIVFLLIFNCNERTVLATNGKPPCCLYVKGVTPSWFNDVFVSGIVHPGGSKLLGRIEKIGDNELYLTILATLNKTEMRETRHSLQLYFDERSVDLKRLIPGKDYILLIPVRIYNIYLDPNMFDFIKIPREIIK